MLKLGNRDNAIRYFRTCIHGGIALFARPSLEYMGQIYLKRNDLDEAKKVYLELCSNKHYFTADPWYYLKVVHEELGDFKKAKEVYKEYKRLRRFKVNRWDELMVNFSFKLRHFKSRPWRQLSVFVKKYDKITRARPRYTREVRRIDGVW